MNLAIVHYHLNRGGVARVVENQLLALDAVLEQADRWRVAILHGGRKEGWNEALTGRLRAIDLELVEVSGLDYDNRPDATARPASSAKQTSSKGTLLDEPAVAPHVSGHLLDKLIGALGRLGFTPEDTVVQIHNHSLGKNVALSASVGPLVEVGYNLLVQIHDFAEDFRPANYRHLARLGAAQLYPQAAGIHYAVLNGRDRSILRAAGVAEGQLHLLANPVPTIGRLTDRDNARKKLQKLFDVGLEQRFLLYPVRGIRRKNLGEMLLMARLAPTETVVGITLAPLNPAETPIYETWKKTAVELNLPCRFEVGGPGKLSFAENLAASNAIVTTSLAEGFGMVMLEPWPVGRSLVGRDLVEITSDFRETGLRFDGLWDRLNVPLDWIGEERFFEQASASYRRTVAAFDRPLPAGWEEGLRDKVCDGMIDFGDLDEIMQKDVLCKVAERPNNRQTVLDKNPNLAKMLTSDPQTAKATIEHNVRAVERHYSLVPSGRRLLDVLDCIQQSPRGGPVGQLARPERILDGFLDARRFRMIRGLD